MKTNQIKSKDKPISFTRAYKMFGVFNGIQLEKEIVEARKNIAQFNQHKDEIFQKIEFLNQENFKLIEGNNLLNQDIENLKEIRMHESKKLREDYEYKFNLISSDNERLIRENKEKDIEIASLKCKFLSEEEKYKDLEEEFKDFILVEYFKGVNDESLKDEELSMLLRMVKVYKKGELKSIEKEEHGNIMDNLFSEEYVKSETCYCGATKSYGSRSCEGCRVKADRYRKRYGINMFEAWKNIWKNIGNIRNFDV
ncbi:MAG TPA: hypothetical protein P5277_04385 [Candidatus Paceibacterota bacterium]|nr:hypothetical protein [Candidatus Paceibacterota bacterium]